MAEEQTISLGDPHADPYLYLGFTRNPDGSITRQPGFLPAVPCTFGTSLEVDESVKVVTKDVTINEANNTWVRIFLPRQALVSAEITKMPLIVDFHGGGFVTGSAATAFFQDYYNNLAAHLPAVVVSVEYRQPPEHPLPAAYEDGVEALDWIKNSTEEWLVKYADLSNCFLAGSSAGSNIAYHVGLRVCSSVDHLLPLRIRGLILHQPFFGGAERTESELKKVDDRLLPPCVTDIMWEMSLPEGADRDHEYSNPRVGLKTHLVDQIKRLGWKIIVKGCDGDPLFDRQVAFVKLLEENGVPVVGSFDEGGFHGREVLDPEKLKAFIPFITREVLKSD